MPVLNNHSCPPRWPLAFPRFIPEPWSACSTTCGPGVQIREVKCRVLLKFTQTETELPAEECDGPELPSERPCLLGACEEGLTSSGPDTLLQEKDSETTYDWEYAGFTPCTATCLGGTETLAQWTDTWYIRTVWERTRLGRPDVQTSQSQEKEKCN